MLDWVIVATAVVTCRADGNLFRDLSVLGVGWAMAWWCKPDLV